MKQLPIFRACTPVSVPAGRRVARRLLWDLPLCAALLLVVSTPGLAQVDMEKVQGEWVQKVHPGYMAEFRLTPAQSARYLQKLNAFATILHETPMFQPPLGIQPRLEAYATYRQEGDTGRAYRTVTEARARLDLNWFFPDRTGKPAWGGEALTIAQMYVNDLAMAFGVTYNLSYEGLQLPDGRQIMFMPRVTEEVNGYPLYDGMRVVVKRSPKPLWVPVSREQYLRALIAFRRQELDSMEARVGRDPYTVWLSEREKRAKDRQDIYLALKKQSPTQAEEFLRTQAEIETRTEAGLKAMPRDSAPPTLRAYRAGVAGMEAELGRMSPAERQSQAWLFKVGDLSSNLLPPGSGDARPLVAINWNYFDRTRRADWQLVTLYLEFGMYERCSTCIGTKRLWEFARTVDWRKVAALLD